MAEEFKPAFVISDRLILFNLHLAGQEKCEKFNPTEINMPDEMNDMSDGQPMKVIQYVGSGLGDKVINSGCRPGLKAPDKTSFFNKASVYEVGLVLKFTSTSQRPNDDSESSKSDKNYNKTNELEDVNKEISKAVLPVLRSYMKVFAGNDAIHDTDIQVIHFGNVKSNATKGSGYIIDNYVIDGKPVGFGYALCKLMYSVGLQRK